MSTLGPRHPALVSVHIYQNNLCRTNYSLGASFVARKVKNLPVMQETWVQSLRWEGPLKKGMAMYSSILACRIPWAEEPGGLQPMGSSSAPGTGVRDCSDPGGSWPLLPFPALLPCISKGFLSLPIAATGPER